MKIRHTLLAAALVAAGAVATPAFAQLKIGFIAELSGPQGALGQDQYDAFMLVVEQNGGKLGGVPVQILKEDSQLKPEVATQIVDKLIEKEKVPIITGITFSNIMMAVHKKITEKEVFLIGSNAGPGADRRAPSARRIRSSLRGRTTTRPRSSASTRPTRATRK
jgi:branched-chain amino acid transport system substrate-binding protein